MPSSSSQPFGGTSLPKPSGGAVTLEEVIIGLPPAHRDVVSELRTRALDAERRAAEAEAELKYARQRVTEAETEAALATTVSAAPTVRAPQSDLGGLIAQLKAQHQARVDAARRQSNEKIRHMDDGGYDAVEVLQTSAARSLRPLPKGFEHVDLLQLREQLTAEGHTPSSPLQAPLVTEFVGHVDGVRQCTRDGRFAQLHGDPIKHVLLRRMFDACKAVESKLGATGHLTLPSHTVHVDPPPVEATEQDIVQGRRKETAAHLSALETCGEVFQRATADVEALSESRQQVLGLPHHLAEFDALVQTLTADADNLQRNEVVLVEAGSLHVENINEYRKQLTSRASELTITIEHSERAIDAIFNEMIELLRKAESQYEDVMAHVQQHAKLQVDVAQCDQRVGEIRKAVEAEVQKQQRMLEGTKLSSFLCAKAKDLYRRLHNNMEESLRSRQELCERVKTTSQEQLYAMAEHLHDIVVKRNQADSKILQDDQAALEAANRALMGLVHQPAALEQQMEDIKELTAGISDIKTRLQQSSADVNSIRAILVKRKTIAFLNRDTNFLTIYDSITRLAKTRDKLTEAVQRLKYVSEVLVEVSDPENRQDFVASQCLDALKVSVSDMTELLVSRDEFDRFDEPFRVSTCAKVRRHRRLIAHFLQELKEDPSGLTQQAPAIEVNAVQLLEGVDGLIASLGTAEERKALMAQRAAQSQPHYHNPLLMGSAGGGMLPSGHVDPTAGGGTAGPGMPTFNLNSSSTGVSPATGPADGAATAATGHPLAVVPAAAEPEQAKHTFSRLSARLKTSHDLCKLSKPPSASIEMPNTSALGAVGFRMSNGLHAFTVRIGPNCNRLLVGFADWNLPLDGYCNSLKYQGCYYLHLGNGTLWAPEQKLERKAFTYEAIGTGVGGLLRAILDTHNRTISYTWNDMNLGVAFRNVNLTRTLYPAFEVFNNGCAIEFVNYSS